MARGGRRPLPRRASDSVHRIQETQAAVGLRPLDGCAGSSSTGRGRRWLSDRRARRTRSRGARTHRGVPPPSPRLTDEVVTLAHGAGGKASAALVDAVFLDAFARTPPRPARRRRHADVAERRTAGVQHRLVRRQAPPVPGRIDRRPRGARHRQRPRRAGRPAALALGGVRDRGGLRRRRAARPSSPTWPRPRPPPASRSSPATPRSSAGAPPTACYITTAGVGVIPAGRDARPRARPARRPGARLRHDRRPRHGGDAGPR